MPWEIPHVPNRGEPVNSKWSKTYWADLAERVGSTEIGALLSTSFLFGATPLDWSDGKVVWITLGAPPAVALLKGLGANMANPESGPSLLPAPPAPDVTTPANQEPTA